MVKISKTATPAWERNSNYLEALDRFNQKPTKANKLKMIGEMYYAKGLVEAKTAKPKRK